MTEKPYTEKVRLKAYTCARCGHEKEMSTNHYGQVYDRCNACSWKHPLEPIVTWECQEEPPPHMQRAPDWTRTTLGGLLRMSNIKECKHEDK